MASKTKKDSQDLISELERNRESAQLGGGKARIQAQHEKGKMTARERILTLLDEGSFQEVDGLMTLRQKEFDLADKKTPGDSVVVGFGKISGRMVASVFPGLHCHGRIVFRGPGAELPRFWTWRWMPAFL